MTNANGVSRGDRNRNARLARLRGLVPLGNAIVAIDLADKKQMVVVTDHDCKVLARKTYRRNTWELGAALDWAAQRAVVKGFAGVTVACEPTGHRWRVLGQLAGERGMPSVCVQPLQTSWARRSEDLTVDKTSGRLRHLGARREELITATVTQVQQLRDLLECVWSAALETPAQPFDSATWVAAMSVVRRGAALPS